MPPKRGISPQNTAIIALALLCVGDLLVPVALSPAYPDYSHLHDTLSTLTTPTSPVQRIASAWLILYGGLWSIALLPLRPDPHSPIHGWAVWGALLVWGLGGGVASGLFPED